MKDTHTPWRKFRLAADLWDRFGEIVGINRRSDDLRAYVEWRVEHPDTALPKRGRRPAAADDSHA